MFLKITYPLICKITLALVLFSGVGVRGAFAQQILNGSESASQFYDGGTIMVYAHQDDDVLWMQPFYSASSKMYLVSVPASQSHYTKVVQKMNSVVPGFQSRWIALKGIQPDINYANNYIPPCKRLLDYGVNFSSFKESLRNVINSTGVKRIITHNNWGEYGHLHHKLVNRAVRELAVQYNKDVWMIATTIPTYGGSYTDLDRASGAMGLPYVRGEFNAYNLNSTRSLYQNAFLEAPVLVNGTPINPYDLWTWYDGYSEFPTGIRSYVKIVSNRVDRSNIASVVSAVAAKYGDEVGRCEEAIGYVDIVSSSGIIQGWTFDGTTSSSSSGVSFYIDSKHVGSFITNRIRDDVNGVFGIYGSHGFSLTVPSSYKDGLYHTLRVYGMDTQTGAAYELRNSGGSYKFQ